MIIRIFMDLASRYSKPFIDRLEVHDFQYTVYFKRRNAAPLHHYDSQAVGIKSAVAN